MDIEDRRRYFIVGSVFLEVVQPLNRTRLENDYTSKGLGSFQDFLNTQQVIHILFHLRHRNAKCCKDISNCVTNSKLPLMYCQWNQLYTENPGQRGHNCHCKFTANPVQLKELILLNCCYLGSTEKNAVLILRRYKNEYLSHNTQGAIIETEYKSLWTDLISFVQQLDPNKQDDLMRIENRPLDEGLCSKYSIDLLNIHKKLNEMDNSIQEIGSSVHGIDSSIQGIGATVHGIDIQIRKLLKYHRNEAIDIKDKLGQDIFYQHCQIDLNSLLNIRPIEIIFGVVMMDDGRLVMMICVLHDCNLLICNTDGSQLTTIPVNDGSYCVTPINNSTVAVMVSTWYNINYIDMFDINKKHKLKSISVPGMVPYCGIAMINNILVVGGICRLLLVDYNTGETVKIIKTGGQPICLHAAGDKIFYREQTSNENKKLYWYSFTKDNIKDIPLPSIPCSITTLPDGSLYVLCTDDSVQHVSSNGKQFKTLNRNQAPFFKDCTSIRYNPKQRKMITTHSSNGIVKILHEI